MVCQEVKPGPGRLCIRVDCPDPQAPPYHMTGEWWEPHHPPSLWLSEQGFLVPWITVIRTYDQLDWFSFIIIIISNNSPLHQSHEKEQVDSYSGCHYAYLVKFPDWIELFSNSHLSILRSFGFSLRSVAPELNQPPSCLAITRTIWSEWTQAWWSLVSFETLGLR
jgi:hypothetical protein